MNEFKEPPATLAWKLPFVLGLGVGLVVLVALRMMYYDVMNYRPEMHPGIVFLFFPVIFVPLCIVAFATEILLRRFWYKSASWASAALIGACYATLYLWWAFPDHWYMIIGINPISLRWLISKISKLFG
jgi:hypothetical protein